MAPTLDSASVVAAESLETEYGKGARNAQVIQSNETEQDMRGGNESRVR